MMVVMQGCRSLESSRISSMNSFFICECLSPTSSLSTEQLHLGALLPPEPDEGGDAPEERSPDELKDDIPVGVRGPAGHSWTVTPTSASEPCLTPPPSAPLRLLTLDKGPKEDEDIGRKNPLCVPLSGRMRLLPADE
eukprot:768088-Hanusia_phi.AAC.5